MNNIKKYGTISIVGETNVGKSTLVNALIGHKVSIVTHKAQTTRDQIIGVYVKENIQIVFYDTPGIFVPKYKLDRATYTTVWNSIEESDFIILLIDSRRALSGNLDKIINNLERYNKDVFCVFNKIDLVNIKTLLPGIEKLRTNKILKDFFLVSAKYKKGIGQLEKYLCDTMPNKNWKYSIKQSKTALTKFFVEELIREKILLNLHDEIPYGLVLQTEVWDTLRRGDITAKILILSPKKTYKPIILGKNGSLIKKISISDRKEIMQQFNLRFNLYLYVKVSSLKDKKNDKEKDDINMFISNKKET